MSTGILGGGQHPSESEEGWNAIIDGFSGAQADVGAGVEVSLDAQALEKVKKLLALKRETEKVLQREPDGDAKVRASIEQKYAKIVEVLNQYEAAGMNWLTMNNLISGVAGEGGVTELENLKARMEEILAVTDLTLGIAYAKLDKSHVER